MFVSKRQRLSVPLFVTTFLHDVFLGKEFGEFRDNVQRAAYPCWMVMYNSFSNSDGLSGELDFSQLAPPFLDVKVCILKNTII